MDRARESRGEGGGGTVPGSRSPAGAPEGQWPDPRSAGSAAGLDLTQTPPIQIQARLVHADGGSRVVEVSAQRGGQWLGSALGEAASAEAAEERALARLLARLGPGALTASPAGAAPVAAIASPLPSSPPPAPAASLAAAPPPAAPAATRRQVAAPKTSAPPLDGAPTAPSPEPPRQPPPEAEPEPATPEPPPDPEDWSSELARLDLELRRLGWGRDQEATYLQRAYGHPSRSRLTTYADLSGYLAALEGLPASAEPATAPVPLRRRDLLAQGDQLLAQLGWGGEQGRGFLRRQLGVASRQLLSDSQLLHFNMLLEGEVLARAAAPNDGRMDDPPAVFP